MKNLIFLLIGFLCFAKAQNVDSLNLIQLKEQLDEKNKKIEVLIQRAEKAEKRNETMFYRLKMYISKLVNSQAKQSKTESYMNNREGIKVENPTDPVTEYDIPSGIDTIRGGWLYRLFHKDKFILKPYKTVDNEKIYLD